MSCEYRRRKFLGLLVSGGGGTGAGGRQNRGGDVSWHSAGGQQFLPVARSTMDAYAWRQGRVRFARTDFNCIAGVKYEGELYAGARHGWCVKDHNVYHEQQAEHAWHHLIGFFNETLK